ncbi:hypothetical protein BDV23DRAFT_176167 [Aspergillus alliaceus]|uniref:Uncharacterized protein n=1 Tax=Petromyces alliaceus TaxID=209559 RepID=A0A5N7BUN2_PETAA|nr:hypothetical protein BDV23DRAFT_176167 [Aspergillus alliaceus]
MKLTHTLLLIVGTATIAQADLLPAPGATDEECGRLGVMHYDPYDLPEGVKPEDVRKCEAHPMSAQNYWGWGKYVPRWIYILYKRCI